MRTTLSTSLTASLYSLAAGQLPPGRTLVDAVYAHSMASGLSGVVEPVSARALGVKPQLRVIEGGAREIRRPLDEATDQDKKNVASA